MPDITIVKFDDGGWGDWEGMYVDGKLVCHGEYISRDEFIAHCGVDLNVKIKTVVDFPDGEDIPDALIEVEIGAGGGYSKSSPETSP